MTLSAVERPHPAALAVRAGPTSPQVGREQSAVHRPHPAALAPLPAAPCGRGRPPHRWGGQRAGPTCPQVGREQSAVHRPHLAALAPLPAAPCGRGRPPHRWGGLRAGPTSPQVGREQSAVHRPHLKVPSPLGGEVRPRPRSGRRRGGGARLPIVLATALLISACIGGGTAAPTPSPSPVAVRNIIPGPDQTDQPSFADRTGRPPALSLQELFHPVYNPPADPTKIRTLLVTGDVITARGVDYFATIRHDFLWPFRPTADYTKNADITYINLESPIFAGCPVQTQGFTFCGDARFVNGLTLMGAKVANLANNHLTNYGAEGTTATVQLLNQHGIQTSGLGPVAVIDVRGVKFGFIGFNGVRRAIDKTALQQGIARARELADIVVVQFHWGKEYERQP